MPSGRSVVLSAGGIRRPAAQYVANWRTQPRRRRGCCVRTTLFAPTTAPSPIALGRRRRAPADRRLGPDGRRAIDGCGRSHTRIRNVHGWASAKGPSSCGGSCGPRRTGLPRPYLPAPSRSPSRADACDGAADVGGEGGHFLADGWFATFAARARRRGASKVQGPEGLEGRRAQRLRRRRFRAVLRGYKLFRSCRTWRAAHTGYEVCG